MSFVFENDEPDEYFSDSDDSDDDGIKLVKENWIVFKKPSLSVVAGTGVIIVVFLASVCKMIRMIRHRSQMQSDI